VDTVGLVGPSRGLMPVNMPRIWLYIVSECSSTRGPRTSAADLCSWDEQLNTQGRGSSMLVPLLQAQNKGEVACAEGRILSMTM
jgi:hypothetical protein